MSLIDQMYLRMDDDLELDQIVEGEKGEKSEVAEFYKNKTIFITGVTGFLGKCLVEKLLRSCPDLKRIYYMIREKGKYSLEDRKKRFFSNLIFDNLRLKSPNFEEKVTAIEGDLGLDDLGLSEKDLNTLINETNIIIHNAANVKFDIKISLALQVNVLGTKYMLDLAKKCENLEIFMYMSTAYSHCYQQHIEEKFYPSPADLSTVHDIIKNDRATDAGMSEQEVKKLIGKFPNVYTFSKAIAEDLVRQDALENLDCAYGVYRPSVVISAENEPTPGYVDNKNGPVLIFVGTGLGVIHACYHREYPIDFIPSDYTINVFIAIMSIFRKKWMKDRQPIVYNYGSSTVNRITMMGIYYPLRDNAWTRQVASKHLVWINFAYCYHSLWTFWIANILFHFIPACLLDLYLIFSRKKPRAVSLFLNGIKHLDKIDYFGHGNWRIHMPNSMQIVDQLNSVDKKLFYCDLRELNWENFSFIMWRGVKLHLLKEDPNDPEGARKYAKLNYLHNTLLSLLILSFSFFIFQTDFSVTLLISLCAYFIINSL